MSRYYTTVNNHKKYVLSKLNRVCDYLRLSHWTHKEYLDKLNKHVFESNSWKRLPQYAQSYVRGVEHERFWGKYGFYNAELEYCHAVNDGRILSLTECRELAKTQPGFWCWLTENRIEEKSGMFYKDTRKKF